MSLGERSVSSNQSLIFDLLVVKGLQKQLLIPLTLTGGRLRVGGLDMRDYLAGLPEREGREVVAFAAKQLRMLGLMAKDQNYTCINYIREHFAAEDILLAYRSDLE
jgi:hypothetical protein